MEKQTRNYRAEIMKKYLINLSIYIFIAIFLFYMDRSIFMLALFLLPIYIFLNEFENQIRDTTTTTIKGLVYDKKITKKWKCRIDFFDGKHFIRLYTDHKTYHSIHVQRCYQLTYLKSSNYIVEQKPLEDRNEILEIMWRFEVPQPD